MTEESWDTLVILVSGITFLTGVFLAPIMASRLPIDAGWRMMFTAREVRVPIYSLAGMFCLTIILATINLFN